MEAEFLSRMYGKGEYFSPNFIRESRIYREPKMVEKAQMCLEYVAQLEANGGQFLFKGGSAVQLLLPEGTGRLSIDVDLAANPATLIPVMEKVATRFEGRAFTYSEKDSSGEVKRFGIRHPTFIEEKPGVTGTILLELFPEHPDYKTQRIRLNTSFYRSSVEVEVPTLNSMLGDKLTCIGPNTIGVPVDDDHRLSNMKHIYDISSLFNLCNDFGEIYYAYLACVEVQNHFRKTAFSLPECTKDLFDFALVTALDAEAAKREGGEKARMHRLILGGMMDIGQFLPRNTSISRSKLTEMGAKLAVCARLLERVNDGAFSPDKATRVVAKLRGYVEANYQNRALMESLIGKLREIPEARSINWMNMLGSPRALPYWFASFQPFEFLGI